MSQGIEYFKGYVTTYSSIDGKPPGALEQALGFQAGSLNGGFRVLRLIEPVGIDDFLWKDRTAYSDGWHFDPAINEFVQRHDELRFQLARESGFDDGATDLRLRQFLVEQRHRLNMRTGPDRIVKVVPNGYVAAFPDASSRTVPQWKLTVPKRFLRMP